MASYCLRRFRVFSQMCRPMLTNEEILITILHLSEESEDQAVHSAEVARLMNVTRPEMHKRIEKYTERGWLVKDDRKKLCFTPAGLAYAANLAKDVSKLQTFFSESWTLSQSEAKVCAFAMVSAMSEDSREHLVCSVDTHDAGMEDDDDGEDVAQEKVAL